jgi:hypothetical protein
VEPPAGIEPATPSLPSMVGPFGGQRGTSLRSIELQVAGLIDDREMGCCEAVRGTAAGKSLARSPVGMPSGRQPRGIRTNRQIRPWCSTSFWSVPDGSALLTLEASSTWSAPDRSRRIVWMIKRMIKPLDEAPGSPGPGWALSEQG